MADFEMSGTQLRKYHGEGGVVVIPDSVTEIYVCAFIGRNDITSVIFPQSLVKIGERAFSGCCGLTALDFPDSLKEIGRESFENCTGLTSVCVPPSVTELDFHAFHGCTSLKHIVSPANVLRLWPFPKSVETAVLDGGTSVSKEAFADFSCLRSVTIRDSVQRVEQGAFARCTSLREIVLPDSVTDICEEAFVDCTALSSVTMGSSLYRIKERAFSGCTALSSLEIPASTVKIYQNAFWGCTALTNCTFADTDRWCRTSPQNLWPPYDKVEGTDVDLTDAQVNVTIVTCLTDTLLFKKRAVPRINPPAKPRFVTPVPTRAENGLFVQGQYFAVLALDTDTEASLWEQVAQFSVMRTEITSHDHDEYGRYTDVETKYYPLTDYRGLTAPHSSYNADFIVKDGKFIGVILCRVFSGSRDAYDEWIIRLPKCPEDRGEHLILLYVDGRVVGANTTNYSDHSGRDYTDSSIEYKLSATPGGETKRHVNWD